MNDDNGLFAADLYSLSPVVAWVVTVCGICGANVYTVNMDPHMEWHAKNDRPTQ